MNNQSNVPSSDDSTSAQHEQSAADAVIAGATDAGADTNAGDAAADTTAQATNEKVEQPTAAEKLKNMFKVSDDEKPNSFVAIFTTILATLAMLYYGIVGIAALALALFAFLLTMLGLAAATGLTVIACIFAVPVAVRALFAVTNCVASFVYNTTNYVCNKFSGLFARKPKVTVNVATA